MRCHGPEPSIPCLVMFDAKVLLGLRERIAALQVLYCDLAHERVAVEAGNVKRRQLDLNAEPSVVRIGLCTASIRSRQLSCAHTLARHGLRQAIDDAAKEGVLDIDEARRLGVELDQVSHRIHMADWAKSDAETAYAAFLEASNDDRGLVTQQRLLETKLQLNALTRQHRECTDQLADMRGVLLSRVDQALHALAMSAQNDIDKKAYDKNGC
jgi:hypothetical protein